MGLYKKTLVDKPVIASENNDLYLGEIKEMAVQVISDCDSGFDIATTEVDTVNNKITKEAHNLLDTTVGQLTTTDTLPSGLELLTDYYILNKTDDDFQLSLTEDGGSVAEVSNIACTKEGAEKEVTAIEVVAQGAVKEITAVECIPDIVAVAEQTTITAIADTSIKEITAVTCVADVDDSLDKKYFILQDDAGSVGFWIDTDNSGTQIDPALVAATDRQVELITVTTNMTATQVASAIYLEVVADSKFAAGADNADGSFTVVSSTYGAKVAAENGNSGFVCTEDTAGVDSNLDGSYFIMQDTDGSVAFWIDVDDSGTAAPSHGADRAVEITTVASADSANTIGGLLRTAINTDAKFTTAGADADCIATNVDTEDLTDAVDGDTGFGFVTDIQGVTIASLDQKYFILQDEIGSVGVWIDVGDSGSGEPVHGADRGLEITTITAGMTATQVASAIYTAIAADSKFEAGADGTNGTFTIQSTTYGPKTDGTAGDSGFTVNENTTGDAGLLDAAWFSLRKNDDTEIAFWIDLDNSGTAEPAHGKASSQEITTITTGMTKGQVGTAIYNVLVAHADFEAGSDDAAGNLLIQNDEYGIRGAIDEGDSGFTMSESQAGAISTVNGKYFILEDVNGTVGIWIDVDNSGTTIPAGANACDRSLEITTITTGMAIGALGDALYTVITNDSKFEAGSNDNAGNLTIQNVDVEPISEQSAGDSGFTVIEGVDYSDVAYLADVGVGTHTFTPEAIAGASMTLQKSCDGTNWTDIASATNITSSGNFMIEEINVPYLYLRAKYVMTAGYNYLKVFITGKK